LKLPNARQGTLDNMPTDFPKTFDVISFMDVLEHLPSQYDSLTRAAQLVSHGGYVIGETFVPHSTTAEWLGKNWHAIDPPNHLAVLSPKAIDGIMTSHGLHMVASTRMARRLSLTSVATKFGRIGGRIAQWMEKTALNQVGVPIQLFDALLWMYRKDEAR
jgi:SAM-dependent methyltransferase